MNKNIHLLWHLLGDNEVICSWKLSIYIEDYELCVVDFGFVMFKCVWWWNLYGGIMW